jgi:hypothetical protein
MEHATFGVIKCSSLGKMAVQSGNLLKNMFSKIPHTLEECVRHKKTKMLTVIHVENEQLNCPGRSSTNRPYKLEMTLPPQSTIILYTRKH